MPGAITDEDYRAMLEALLEGGAAPDPPWDNGITLLMLGGLETAKLLLKYGANVEARDVHGRTAMHWAQTAEKARRLAAHNADINARATPPASDTASSAATPLQYKLALARIDGLDVARTLIDLGADLKLRDGSGRSTLTYCSTREAFRLVVGYGLDPLERLPDGGTLLHSLVGRISSIRAKEPSEVEYLKYLLSLGLDINATNGTGQTILHLLHPELASPEDVALLKSLGADPSVRDKSGRTSYDFMPRSRADLREALRP